MKNKLFLHIFCYCLLLYSIKLYAYEIFPKKFEPKPVNRVMPSQDPYYGAPETAIEKMLLFKSLIYAQSDLQLGKNTVATPEDIKGSNYLVTNAWWNALTKDCATHGQNLTIKPFK